MYNIAYCGKSARVKYGPVTDQENFYLSRADDVNPRQRLGFYLAVQRQGRERFSLVPSPNCIGDLWSWRIMVMVHMRNATIVCDDSDRCVCDLSPKCEYN